MRRLVWMVVAVAFLGTGMAAAETKVSGYLAPNFMMVDQGDEAKSNIGFGMYFNRFTFSGSLDGGEVLKGVKYKVEADVRPTALKGPALGAAAESLGLGEFTSSLGSPVALQWAYVEPWFSDAVGFRFGHVKRAFSREYLHPTYNLLTAMRHPTTSFLTARGYAGFGFGLEAVIAASDMIKITAGSYTGGEPEAFSDVRDQDPAIDFGGRVVLTPIAHLEIGANAHMTTLPCSGEISLVDSSCVADLNGGVYDKDTYESNSGLAFGGDVDLQTNLNGMALWAQAELGMGDNWKEGPKDPAAGDTWEDYSWHSFMYYYLKFRLMVTQDFGVHFGYSSIDPNTDADDDVTTMLTPGITYFWGPFTRTEVEVQMQTIGSGNPDVDDDEFTHFLIQQVLVWE